MTMAIHSAWCPKVKLTAACLAKRRDVGNNKAMKNTIYESITKDQARSMVLDTVILGTLVPSIYWTNNTFTVALADLKGANGRREDFTFWGKGRKYERQKDPITVEAIMNLIDTSYDLKRYKRLP